MKRVWIVLWALLAALSAAGCAAEEGPALARLRADTAYLCQQPRPTGTQAEVDACNWLEGRLEELGYTREDGTLERTAFQGLGELTSENLMARCAPAEEGPILCVVAHYDSVAESPGARDNAASVAILLELARSLGPEGEGLPGEVRLIFLGSEENGYHGARAYVEGLSPQERARHLAVFNMDISATTAGEGELVCSTWGAVVDGTYQEGDFLVPADNAVSRAISAAREGLGGEPVPLVHGGESDHVVFHQWEIEAANVCWRQLKGGLPALFPEYHQATDIAETVDYATALETFRCVHQALLAWSD